jgi:hypothetical protein
MGKKLITLITLFLFMVIIPLSACVNHKKGEKPIALMNATTKVDLINGSNNDRELIEQVRKEILSIKPIYDVAIIKGKKETLIAYRVKHLHRFKMKKIEKEINERLEEEYPNEDFILSSDFKIFLETNRLINKTKQSNYSDEKANKDLQKIIKLKNELT